MLRDMSSGGGSVQARLERQRSRKFAGIRFGVVILFLLSVTVAIGVFFFEDMTAPIRTLLRAVRPGGSIVVAIWGEGFWEPQNTVFDERIRRHRPDLYKGFQAWYRISTAADLAVLLTTAGATNVTVHTEHAVHLVSGVEGWWQVMWGSGYRGTLSQLTPTELTAVHEEHMQEIQPLVDGDGRLALAVPVHFGVAQVPDR